ncbi:protein ALP1-like [Gigantopelta aegis]|uniref:protein ALP1-like n=1 Tax=Gigantopelta aegis TaxID=1735272 RepID=UPI001B88BB8F|nr:protein ALP1-like [Gigantopelta aegis]
MPLPTSEDWRNCARRFGELWDYPFAIGALDGKHIPLYNPIHAGSMYYNYKGYPSIVLMAFSDADSCFILTDCGQYGRISDGGVSANTCMCKMLNNGKLNIPSDGFRVSTSDLEIPYMIIADEAFPLKAQLMKPYPGRGMDDMRRAYNYRHSRARRSVECAFGILAKKFEIFQRAMRLQPDKAVMVTNAGCVLHNFIRRRDGQLIDRSSDIVYEEIAPLGGGMIHLQRQGGGRAADRAVAIRDAIKDFVTHPDGTVF